MSYRQPDPFYQVRRSVGRTGAPLTVAICALCVVLFLATFLTRGSLTSLLDCNFIGGRVFPLWGCLTYPLLTGDFIALLFGVIWFYGVGASLERSWGMARYAGVLAGITLLDALSIWVGVMVLHVELFAIAGLWLPLAALTCAWAAINPTQGVMFNFFIPMQARWLAIISVCLVYFEEFGGAPLLGLFSLIPPVLAWYYVRGDFAYAGRRGYRQRGPDLKIVRGRSSADGSQAPSGPVGWLRSWQERRRLRKLFRDSGFSDRDTRR